MFTKRTHRTVLAGVSLLAAGMMVTACGDKDSADSGSGKSDAVSAQSSSGGSAGSGGSGGSTSGDKGGSQGTSGAGGGSAAGTETQAGAPGSKGYRGTVQGDLKYLAPGKFTLDSQGKTIGFFVREGVKVTGYGTLCGNPGEGVSCSVGQLESATKEQSVPVSVDLDGGTASKITERKPGTAGGDAKPAPKETTHSGEGTWVGSVEYLAPQKFTLKTSKGREEGFAVTADTRIAGHGEICGEGQNCTPAQLESATKSGGVGATVVLKNGVATSVVEAH